MIIDLDTIATIIEDAWRRAEYCKQHGISVYAVMCGAKVPPGWVLDDTLSYFMPPTDTLH